MEGASSLAWNSDTGEEKICCPYLNGCIIFCNHKSSSNALLEGRECGMSGSIKGGEMVEERGGICGGG